jgi:hypothetical protein
VITSNMQYRKTAMSLQEGDNGILDIRSMANIANAGRIILEGAFCRVGPRKDPSLHIVYYDGTWSDVSADPVESAEQMLRDICSRKTVRVRGSVRFTHHVQATRNNVLRNGEYTVP